jgi:hypothetical protein
LELLGFGTFPIIQNSKYYKTQCFGNWVCFRPQMRGVILPIIYTNKQTNKHVRFEVFTAVTMKKGVFWDVAPCGSCKNRRFEGTLRLLHQGDKNR